MLNEQDMPSGISGSGSAEQAAANESKAADSELKRPRITPIVPTLVMAGAAVLPLTLVKSASSAQADYTIDGDPGDSGDSADCDCADMLDSTDSDTADSMNSNDHTDSSGDSNGDSGRDSGFDRGGGDGDQYYA